MNTDTKIAKNTIQAGIEALKKLSNSLNMVNSIPKKKKMFLKKR